MRIRSHALVAAVIASASLSGCATGGLPQTQTLPQVVKTVQSVAGIVGALASDILTAISATSTNSAPPPAAQ
ncbi:MAG TPA: hypothetical protein VGG48_19155 [Rhizomicrobium sp.]|jgi:outer membrane murein-binding lipoprotein Lpp